LLKVVFRFDRLQNQSRRKVSVQRENKRGVSLKNSGRPR